MKFVHLNFISKNWSELAKFYIKTFDCKILNPHKNITDRQFKIQKNHLTTNSNLKSVFLILPGYGENGPVLKIYQSGQMEDYTSSKSSRVGFASISFLVDNIPQTLLNIERNGGEFTGKVTKIKLNETEEVIYVYARDPEANLIELQSCKKST